MKYLFTLFFFITVKCYSQSSELFLAISDTISISSEQVLKSKLDRKIIYCYRLSFDQINSKWLSNPLQSELSEIFKSQVYFEEGIRQFIFQSSEDVTEFKIKNTLTNYALIYFKKYDIAKKNEL